MSSKRFEILDLYRFLAILMVMIYHYLTRWCVPNNPVDLYPYDSNYNYFLWGRLGVQFFFIISGFVIYMTLERSLNLLDFAKKRIVRLLPAMMLISTITYLVFILFDKQSIFPDSHKIENLFYSWTFLGQSMNPSGLTYIDGSYWSLWVEIQFYFLASMLFFFLNKVNKPTFFSHVLFLVAVLVAAFKPFLVDFNQIFNLFLFFDFFVLGVIFKELFRLENPWSKRNWYWHAYIALLLVIEWLRFADDRATKLFDLLFILAFYLFIYLSKRNWSVNWPFFSFLVYLGEASYISYLLHQNIGVLIINKIAYQGPFDFLVPLGVIAIIFLTSAFVYKNFEKPMMLFLKSKIGNKNSSR